LRLPDFKTVGIWKW